MIVFFIVNDFLLRNKTTIVFIEVISIAY